MLISDPRDITFRRRPARLFALRNNGYCWGRVIDADGAQWDVDTAHDWYDYDDDDALDAFERAAKRGKVEPLAGAPLGGGLR